MIPSGKLRNKWCALRLLVFVFIAGYAGYATLTWGKQTQWGELPVPGIFMLGALFVWTTISLALQTATDLRRIHVLEAENVTDPLTKVFNRRYLDGRLKEEFARSTRYALGLSVLMIDIDHFKRVNDTYGHHAGDMALQTVSARIKQSLRDLDVVSRYGGEEFLVICTNTAIDGATLVANRIRKLIEETPVEITDGSGTIQWIPVTLSIGAAGLTSTMKSQDELVQSADKALYRAKEEGRNRVMVA